VKGNIYLKASFWLARLCP